MMRRMSDSAAAPNVPVEPAADWRQALIYGAASDAGILSSLPGTPPEVAAASGADERATRVVLEALEVWGFVASDGDGRYDRGPAWPSDDVGIGLLQQARFIRGTAAHLPERMRGEVSPMGQRSGRELDQWQAGMAARARTVAPAIADACLARVTEARSVLELGGGHGEYGLEFARRGLHVVLQDRPAVLEFPHRREVWAAAGVELFPGDFFEVVPERRFDLVLVAGVTHTFDGEHNRRLYQRLRPLSRPAGRWPSSPSCGARPGPGCSRSRCWWSATGATPTPRTSTAPGWTRPASGPRWWASTTSSSR